MDDYWNVDGERELSDAWTGFTRFILLNKRPPEGYTWSRERLTSKQTTSRPDNVWPDMWKHMSDAAKSKAKQKWTIEKSKIDNARQLRGILRIEMEMDSHGGLEVTIRQTEWKKKLPNNFVAQTSECS